VGLHVAILADEYLARESLREWLVTAGHRCSVLDASDLTPISLRRLAPDLVLLDADTRRLAISRAVTLLIETLPGVSVVLLADAATVPRALRSIEAGAFDVIEKPVRPEKITALLHKAERFRTLRDENRALRARLDSRHDLADLLGAGPTCEALDKRLDQVADGDDAVLVTGERGTGKLLLARILHERGGGTDEGFVEVDGGMLRGTAFWRRVREGLITAAHATPPRRMPGAAPERLTLCVLSLEALPAADRSQLVAAATTQSWTATTAGLPGVAVRSVVTSRLTAATLLERGLLTDDELAMVGPVHVHLPALRERGPDLLGLASRLLEQAARHHGRSINGFDVSARRALLEHGWEGNVRELMAVVEHAVALCQGEQVGVEHLPGHLLARPALLPDGSGPRTLREVEHAHILRTLTVTRGNKLRAARLLGINRMTLYNKLREIQTELSGAPSEPGLSVEAGVVDDTGGDPT